MITLDNVSVIFNPGTDREVHALRNVSLVLQQGQWLTVVGPNGSGKSTLLRVLSGAVPATAGTMSFDGRDFTDWPQWRRAAIFQHLEQETIINLVPSMTIEENLVLGLCRSGFSSFHKAINKERHTRILNCLSEFDMGLEGCIRTQVRFLSGGQRAAVVVARALLQSTKVLLLDEVTASLDPNTAPLLLKHIFRLTRKRNLSVIMVTHDMEEALASQGDVLFLDRGKPAIFLTPDMVSADQLRDLFANAIVQGKPYIMPN